MYYSTIHATPVGLITMGCDGENLVGLWIEGQKYHGGTLREAMVPKDDFPVFDAAKQWLKRYFAGEKPPVSELSLAPVGGEFRQAVWKILCEIPYGEVITYGGIAKRMAARMGKEACPARR